MNSYIESFIKNVVCWHNFRTISFLHFGLFEIRTHDVGNTYSQEFPFTPKSFKIKIKDESQI